MPALLFNSRAVPDRVEVKAGFTLGALRSWQFIHFLKPTCSGYFLALSWIRAQGAYGLGSRPSADGQTPTTAKVVMFLIHDPYIPPRHKRQLFELVARAGSRIKRAFRLCRACFPLTKGSSYLGCFDDEVFCYQTPKAQSLGSRVGIRCITKNTGGPL